MIIASLYPCPFDPQIRHDFNSAILRDDEVYAYEEDKLTGIKNEYTVQFPERSLMMGMKQLDLLPRDVDTWVFPTPRETPRSQLQFLFFAELVKAYEGSFAEFDDWYAAHVRFVDHHISHVGAAIYTSDFSECAFVSQDGGGDMGDPRNMICGEYRDGAIEVLAQAHGLHNICSFHAFVTDACGFSGGENGKTSGLAAYGTVQPELYKSLRTLLRQGLDGIEFSRQRFSRTPVNLAKVKPQEYDRNKIFLQVPSDTNVLRMAVAHLPHNIAATGEAVMQDIFMDFLRDFSNTVSSRKISFSGGLFQNVALNRTIAASGLFDEYFYPMTPSDAGLALGAALHIKSALRLASKVPIGRSQPLPAFIGPSYSDQEVQALLDRFRLRYSTCTDPAAAAASLLAAGYVVGWFQGRAEHGQRSLGARSILADPRYPESKQRVNQRLKRRDWFMPYAPSILEEYVDAWCEIASFSPYMQIAFTVPGNVREQIPAAVHIDGTSRVNVVRKSDNPLYWRLVEKFREITGLPVVLNTSFNRHGIPTISSPRQALEHLLEGCMDYLVVGGFIIAFHENRLVDDTYAPLEPESELLADDCIQRISTVARMGTTSDLDHYLGRLSELVGQPVLRDGDVITVPGRERIRLNPATR